MVLQSVASGSTLCIYEGQVSGKGIRDSHCERRTCTMVYETYYCI